MAHIGPIGCDAVNLPGRRIRTVRTWPSALMVIFSFQPTPCIYIYSTGYKPKLRTTLWNISTLRARISSGTHTRRCQHGESNHTLQWPQGQTRCCSSHQRSERVSEAALEPWSVTEILQNPVVIRSSWKLWKRKLSISRWHKIARGTCQHYRVSDHHRLNAT